MDNLTQWCFAWFEGIATEGRDRAGLWLNSKWIPGSTVTISFLDGDPALQKRVKAVAEQWIQPGRARMFFDFRPGGTNTHIRISFAQQGSWSVLGTTCQQVAAGQPTMNFGWLTPASSDAELERVVLHEFGHALGLVHEHQLPANGIQWNKPAVYADLEPKWSREKIDHNLFKTIDPAEAAMTTLDPRSIMLYPIKKSWTLDGFSSGLNTTLSPIDIAFISTMYPATL